MDILPNEKKEEELKTDIPPDEKKVVDVPKTSSLPEAIGAGAFAGAVGGLAAHYLAGGRMTLPIFLVVSILLLGGLKGWAKFVALVIFVIVAAFIVVLFQHLSL